MQIVGVVLLIVGIERLEPPVINAVPPVPFVAGAFPQESVEYPGLEFRRSISSIFYHAIRPDAVSVMILPGWSISSGPMSRHHWP